MESDIPDRSFTVSEAAFVLAEPVKTVKNALDTGPVVPTLKRRAGSFVRTVAWRDLFHLFLLRTLRDQLAPAARAELYAAMSHFDPDRDDEIRLGRLRVDVSDLKPEFAARAEELAVLTEQVDFRADGEPLVKGRDIEIYRVSALVEGGMTDAEIIYEHPSLTVNDIAVPWPMPRRIPRRGVLIQALASRKHSPLAS